MRFRVLVVRNHVGAAPGSATLSHSALPRAHDAEPHREGLLPQRGNLLIAWKHEKGQLDGRKGKLREGRTH